MIWPGCRLPFCHSLTRIIKILLESFSLSRVNWVKPVQESDQISRSIDIPIIIDAAFLHDIQICSWSSGDVNVFQWNREWFSLSASKVWLWVQRDGGIWSFLTRTKNHFVLRHPEMSHETVVKETLLILQENFFDLLLELGGPVSRWMFSVPNLLQWIWFVHLRLETWISPFWVEYYFHFIESFRVDFPCVHRFQLLNVCKPLCHPSKFSPRTLSFQIDGFLTGLSQR